MGTYLIGTYVYGDTNDDEHCFDIIDYDAVSDMDVRMGMTIQCYLDKLQRTFQLNHNSAAVPIILAHRFKNLLSLNKSMTQEMFKPLITSRYCRWWTHRDEIYHKERTMCLLCDSCIISDNPPYRNFSDNDVTYPANMIVATIDDFMKVISSNPMIKTYIPEPLLKFIMAFPD